MNAYLGELAAIGSALIFSASSVLNTQAGRQVGSTIVNRIRLLLAVICLISAHWLLHIPLPTKAGVDHWWWLSISGIIGLAIGDAFLFQAFIWIGPQLSMLLMSLSPLLSGLLAWIFLNEVLTPLQWIGMMLTMLGIAWVILDRRGNSGIHYSGFKHYRIGILFGLGAAIGQALGLVLAKRGLYDNFPALSGTLIRMLAAMVVLWTIAIFQHEAKSTLLKAFNQPKVAMWLLLASFLGPVLGVTLSLYAVQQTEVGIASTLLALPPIVLLPVSYFYYRERFGWASILGTLLTMIGVALFFLAPTG